MTFITVNGSHAGSGSSQITSFFYYPFYYNQTFLLQVKYAPESRIFEEYLWIDYASSRTFDLWNGIFIGINEQVFHI